MAVSIQIENLVKSFGALRAVDHVSLRIAPGEYVHDFADPQATLLRVLYSPQVTGEAKLKAWDLLCGCLSSSRSSHRSAATMAATPTLRGG